MGVRPIMYIRTGGSGSAVADGEPDIPRTLGHYRV